MDTKQSASSPKRRWLSFSLRGLFLVITIACIWLAVVATRARNQQQAVAKVQKLGGIVSFDYQRDDSGRRKNNGQPRAPQWLRRAIGEDYFRRVASVDFNFGGGNKATDEDLAVFRSLPDVTTLELNNNPKITDAGLEHLSGLSKLRVLYLYRSQIKGPGIRHLPRNLEHLLLSFTPLEDAGLVPIKDKNKLKSLGLGHTKITDHGLSRLAGAASLEDLRLEHTVVTDAGLEHLKALPNLKSLDLSHTNVTSRGIVRLQQALPNCRVSPDPKWLDATPQDVELWPDGYKPTTAEVAAKVAELGSAEVEVDKTRPGQPIVSLMLHNSTISDESVIRLLEEMPELELLNLRGVLVGDRLAKELPRFPKLWYLSFQGSRITDEGLAHIGQVTSLRQLYLGDNRISDDGFEHLSGLSKLEYLETRETGISEEGFARLQQALPKCRVSR